MVMKLFENKLGLPSLERLSELASGATGKQLERLLNTLIRLNSDREAMERAMSLLKTLDKLNSEGGLERAVELLKEANALMRSRKLNDILDRIEHMAPIAEKLLGGLKSD